MRVLVVEDHRRLAEAVAAGLRDEGMAVDVVLDGQDALDHVAMTRYDVLVLDRDLPGMHGDEVCRALAADRCPTRVLMLTAASTVADRVDGLAWARTTTCRSRSTSPSWWPGSGRWAGGPARPCPRCSTTATSPLTQPGASRSGPDAAWR